MKNLKFYSFISTKSDGQMNTNASFYHEGASIDERRTIMRANKQKVAERLGINYTDLFIPIQKNIKTSDKYDDGHTLVLTQNELKKYTDLYDFDYNCDIVKLTRDVPYVAACYPVADCPVITAVNLKTEEAVMAHCGGEYINRYLPMQLIDSLGGNEKDILVHVLPFAHSLTYSYGEPTWISNKKIWDESLTYSEKGLEINILNTVKKMLKERHISDDNTFIYPFDTIKDNNFYSNSNQFNGVKEDAGRQIAGICLTDKAVETPYIKVFSKIM